MASLTFILSLAILPGQQGGPPVLQEPAQYQEAEPVVLEDLEVVGRRGAALVTAESEVGAAQIALLGAENIGEVIFRLTEDYALGEGPVVIVNGHRLADPGVFYGFPPEALERVEVLPFEAGGLYGSGEQSQRVVNIVLRRRFSSREWRASVRRPTAGGQSNIDLNLRQSSILDTRTRQLAAQAGRDTALHASERVRPDGSDAGDVTLRPASESLVLSLAETTSLGPWAASLRAIAQVRESHSTSLRAGEVEASSRRWQGIAVTGGLSGDLSGWSTRLTLNGSLSEADQAGWSLSRSRQHSVSASIGLSRPLFRLPAGAVTANISARNLQFRSVSESLAHHQTQSRQITVLSGGLSVPLSRRFHDEQAESLLGNLALSLGADLNDSDSGRGEGLNAAVSWMPREGVRFAGSWARSTESLSEDHLFGPEYFGDPITVFDFAKGEAVEVLPLLGGNPELKPPTSERISLSASVGPFTPLKLQGGLGFQIAEEANGIGVLPNPTPEIESAFPERFQRDAMGRLVGIDRRPINLASSLTEALSSNLGLDIPLGRDAALRLVLNHSWQLRSRTSIREDLPEMNRLAGDGGGLPQQNYRFAADVRWGELRLNAEARRRGGYRIRRTSGQNGPDDLRIAPLSVVDLEVTYDLSSTGAERGQKLELSLEIANLFDARPSATLGDGRAAPGYGRDDQDPVGRTALITLKGRF